MIAESIEKLALSADGYNKLAEAVSEKMALKRPLTSMAIIQWRKRGSVPAKYISALVEIGGGVVSHADFLSDVA